MKLFLEKYLVVTLFVVLLLIFSCMSIFTWSEKKDNSSNLKALVKEGSSVQIGNTKIGIEIAESSFEKAEGLSGREGLSENTGMLFVFNTKTKPGFWMIDMKFPLDIIWISDNKVVDITKNALPEPGKTPGELKHYFPSDPVNYALEVNAGFSEKNNINIGDSVIFNLE